MEESIKKYKEGHFMGLGIAFGVAFGAAIFTPMFIMFDQTAMMGLGPAFGISIGVAIGAALESKYKKEGKIIPLTEEEKAKQKQNGKKVALIGLGLLVLFALVAFFFIMR
mgnify:CR=1 FL=1